MKNNVKNRSARLRAGCLLLAVFFNVSFFAACDSEGDFSSDMTASSSSEISAEESSLESTLPEEENSEFIPSSEEGAEYFYVTLDDVEKKNTVDKEAMDTAVASYQAILDEEAEDAYAGSNCDFAIPAVDWLIKDDGGYRNLRFTISYKTPCSSSARISSNNSYNNLDISITEEGLYEFKIFAIDKDGNKMQYYLNDELVEVSTGNIWDIEEIPSFTFEVKNRGLIVEETSTATGRKVEKLLNETYTLSGLTVKGASNQQSAYALYRLDTTAYNGPAITLANLINVRYEEIRARAIELLAQVGTEVYPTYFDLYLDIYAGKIATAIDGNKAAVKACFKEIKAFNANITENDPEWEEYNKYNWNASSKSFKTAEEGEYLILADFWEKELPMQRAAAYKVIVVEGAEDSVKANQGESGANLVAWLRNSKVVAIFFDVIAWMKDWILRIK